VTKSRRIGAALMAAGLACGGGALAVWQAVPAHADSSESTSLSSYELHGGGRGINYWSARATGSGFDTPPGMEMGAAEAALASGPVGSGVASFVWPGPIAANGGTLLLVLQPGCSATQQAGIPDGATPICPIPPDIANQANVPFRAESHTGSKVPAATNDPAPGIHLQSSALNNDVSADAVVNQVGGGLGNFGKVVTHGETTTDSSSGTATGSSTIQNVDLGPAGTIHIGSIISNAKAQTFGDHASGDASTVVGSMTIGGTPVTVDKDGVHVQSGTLPTGAAVDGVNKILANFKMTITLGTPTKDIKGASGDVTAPPLIITFGDPTSQQVMILGGATASVTSAGGGGGDLSDLTSDLTSFDSTDTGSADLGSSGAIDTSSLSDSGPSATPTGTARRVGTGDQALGATQNLASHGKPIKTGAILLAVLGAGLLALGMRRLSDDVLAERAATSCPLDEEAS